MTMTKLDTIDIHKKAPLPVKICYRYGLSCSLSKKGTPHPLPQKSDWSDEDWEETKAKAWNETVETNLLSDWDLPKPQSEHDLKLEIDKLDIDKPHIEQGSPKEEWIEVTNSLIPPPMTRGEGYNVRDNRRNKGRDERSGKEIPTRRKEMHTTGSTLVTLVRKKKKTPDQNILVTATFIKKERTFPYNI